MSQIANSLTRPQILVLSFPHYILDGLELSERVDLAIKAYETKPTLEATETLKKVMEDCLLCQNIKLSRTCLLKILKIKDEAMQLSAVYALRELLIPQTFLFDIQNAQLSEFADLEARVREFLIEKISLSPNQETLEHILNLYEDVVERAGFLSYQKEESTGFSSIIQENAKAVENSLLQLSIPSKIHYLATFRKMVQLFTKEREDVEKIRPIKEAFAKSNDPYVHSFIGDFFQIYQMYTRCHTHFERNLQILTERHKGQTAPDLLEWEKKAYLKLGNMRHVLGKHSSAILCYKQMLKRAKQLGDCEWEKTANYSLGKAFTIFSNYPKVIQHYKGVFADADKDDVETSLVDGQALVGLGTVHKQQGRYEDAKNFLNRGLSIIDQNKYDSADHIQDVRTDARTIMGNLYKHLGDWSNAIKEHTKALECASNEELKAMVKMNLGNVYLERGQTLASNTDVEMAVQCFRGVKDQITHPYYKVHILANLGAALIFLEKYDGEDGAASYCTQALKLLKDDKKCECSIYLNLGGMYQSQKKYLEAEDAYKRAITLAHDLGNKLAEAAALCNLGHLLKETGNVEEALQKLRESINIFATLQESVGDSNEWKITIFEGQINPYYSLEDLLLQQKKYDKALEVTDERRARALVSTLLKKQSSTVQVKSLTSAEMQAVAKQQNSTLIVYSMAPLDLKESPTYKVGVWVIPPEGDICFHLLDVSSMANELRDAKAYLSDFPYYYSRRGDAESESGLYSQEIEEPLRGENTGVRERILGRFKMKLENWYKTLIQPIEKNLPQTPDQPVTIISEGYLSQLSFAAFQDEKGDYLIEKHAISYAPSIQALKLLSQTSGEFSQSSLVVGNPDTLINKYELKLAENEAHIVGSLLKIPLDKLILNKAATPSRVLEEMQKSQWIHLACHGEVGETIDPKDAGTKINVDSVFRGFLRLSPDNEHQIGHLHAQEVTKISLKAKLVFLSCCYSGSGKLQNEGVIGFPWTLLASGAQSVVGAYWVVPESDLTVEMVQTFYTALINGDGKISKAQALRHAMLKGIQAERANPRLWASFFLSGSTI